MSRRKVKAAKAGLLQAIRDDQEYQEALNLAQTYVPKESRDYGWVVEHANRQFEMVQDALDRLDQKAAGLINFLGAFGGASVVASIYGVIGENWVVGLAILPSVLAAATGICLALRVLAPTPIPHPPNAERALRYAEAYPPEVAPVRFALQTWAAFEAARVHAGLKSKRLRQAMGAFACAVGLLAIPCVLAAFVTLG